MSIFEDGSTEHEDHGSSRQRLDKAVRDVAANLEVAERILTDEADQSSEIVRDALYGIDDARDSIARTAETLKISLDPSRDL